MHTLHSHIRTVPDFPKPGIMFYDIMPLFSSPDALREVVEALASAWHGKVDRIAALEARGFLFGTPLSLALSVPLALVRKKGKLPGAVSRVSYALEYGTDCVEMQDGAVHPGERVLVLDDLLATGGTAGAACTLLAKAGASIAGCQFLIELAGLPGRTRLAPHAVHTLVTYDA